MESDEPVLQSSGTNCDIESSTFKSINNITFLSADFQEKLDMLSPYQKRNELGQRRPDTPGKEISSNPSVKTLGKFVLRVLCRLLRRHEERPLWNQ